MVLESTMLCVDNSDYMRNGDFAPSRLQAEQDAVNLICNVKIRANAENNVGLLAMAEQVQVLSTLTQDASKIFMKMHQVQPKGACNFMAGIRVAHLALKHRQGRNHKTRIVVFVGSPVELDGAELTKLAKRLKKEKVNVDVINFGEEGDNVEKLNVFIQTLNGKDGGASHLVNIPPGSVLADALLSSPVLAGEDGAAPMGAMGGAGMEFGVDPNDDPELAMVLRVSMEEQRARQEAEAARATEASANEMQPIPEEPPAPAAAAAGLPPNSDAMTEEEQIAYALQMSMQQGEAAAGSSGDRQAVNEPLPMEAMDADVNLSADESGPDMDDLAMDAKALEAMVETLPGVDPKSKEVQDQMASMSKDEKKKDGKEKDEKEKPKPPKK